MFGQLQSRFGCSLIVVMTTVINYVGRNIDSEVKAFEVHISLIKASIGFNI